MDKEVGMWVAWLLYEHLRGRSTGLSKKMDGIWNRYNLKSTGRIYTFCVFKCSEEFKVLDLPQYICKLNIVKLNLI